ncbi:MAG: zf-TFIIB domain-containing protein [Bacteroidota bacterium]
MDCPVCKKAMIVLELDQVEIDHCTSCSGIWLDDGELELLLEDAEEKRRVLSTLHVDSTVKEKSRRCPKCSKKMNKVFIGNNNEVLVDSCKKQHGIWFDNGELHDVIKLASIDRENKILKLLNEMFRYNLSR